MFDDLFMGISSRIEELEEDIQQLKDEVRKLEALEDNIQEVCNEAANEIAEHRRDRISQAEYDVRDLLSEAGFTKPQIDNEMTEFEFIDYMDDLIHEF